MPETTLAIFNGDDFNLALSDLTDSGTFSSNIKKPLTNAITLIHFRDNNCRCSRINDKHFNRIVETYSPRGINIITINKHDLAHNSPLQNIPSSPAAAIIDTHGKLAYFGPYSLNALCNQENGFVETTLNTLLAQQSVSNIHTMGEGCFCPWRLQPSTSTNSLSMQAKTQNSIQTKVKIRINNQSTSGKYYA